MRLEWVTALPHCALREGRKSMKQEKQQYDTVPEGTR
jgi:hypothetical protein